jgi:hypothetical protein
MSETREFSTGKYTVSPLALGEWRKLFAIVTRYAGVLAAATTAGGNGLSALSSLTMGIDEQDLAAVESLIGSASFVITDGPEGAKKYDLNDPKKRSAHFTGNYASYMKWLAFGLEVNFRPLLAELGKPSSKDPAATESSQ